MLASVLPWSATANQEGFILNPSRLWLFCLTLAECKHWPSLCDEGVPSVYTCSCFVFLESKTYFGLSPLSNLHSSPQDSPIPCFGHRHQDRKEKGLLLFLVLSYPLGDPSPNGEKMSNLADYNVRD